ncbi:MAG: WD40/YVTN/BNR-like repeat-containing protein [Longimicrobiales bacterium]
MKIGRHLAHAILTFSTMLAAAPQSALAQQTSDFYSDLHWRSIGPTRAGRGRALAGVPSQRNVFYVSFDNGGVWRTTDYGSTWHPIFDKESTSSIGALAVAESDPNVIYVGTGGGIIRPDLSTGDGIYKSTDAGATWTRLGLYDSQMIAQIAVDPTNPDRLFVAVLGHPYGPNEERGIFRSTDGGRTFEKVLYKDEYTSGNEVLIDPSNPNTVYAALWQQQQSFREGDEFGGAGERIFKSTDGGTTWRPLTQGLPSVFQANLAIAPSNPRLLYAVVAGSPGPVTSAGPQRDASVMGIIGLYKSTDAGEHWTPVIVPPGLPGATAHVDTRPLARIGGGDLPTFTVDPKNENVIYSATVVMWKSEDGGVHWSPIRGAYGGDDYQRIWINPNDTKIILTISDQGAVISANGGESWSNWYTQPTAALYHVTTDNAFPYRVCSGQQDSGSACVKSRSDDGMITFHDWHPVGIQEYGIAAPDPRDPDMVFGSMRTDVSLYDRRTGQKNLVGPDMGPRGGPFNRNVRTMPIEWSPLDPDLLFYTSNAVWKTRDRGASWTRISPDLTRQGWSVPASAGTYADRVTPGAQGAITALALSPLDVGVIWAGTDDGNIQVTTDGGANWANVTPPGVKPWTRIFNIEAGRFDEGTAYAAANTMRVDDMNPHFWRTHDGGKTWTEINNGLAPGAVANAIREDPRVRGLLYAATETQVWFSTDDGANWQSLRLDMPAVSVRDIQVKDDTTCLCSDLIAATHGRGFWILDNVTPLRQITQARAAAGAYLFEPVPAVRVRSGTNDPTEWTPEVAHGENPLPGGIIDYYLAREAAGPVTLDVLNSDGNVVRSYSSDDPVLVPDPALDPAGYNEICKREPTAPNCRVPLYWLAPQIVLSTERGMHRFTWDLHFEPLGPESRVGGGATGAVPGHTYPRVDAPWAPPGEYTVRLTVDGRAYTQPLSLRLDPRVRMSAAEVARVASLSREMWKGAVAANAAYEEARSLLARLDARADPNANGLKAQVEALAPAPAPAPTGRAAGPSGPLTLESLGRTLMSAAMALQDAEAAPTAREVAACDAARAAAQDLMARWNALSASALDSLDADGARSGSSR